MGIKTIGFVLAVGAACPEILFCATRQVGNGQTYTTIQSCMNAAATGDVCNVHAGTYSENIIFSTSGVTLQANPGDTVNVNGTVDIKSNANSVVNGFTFTGVTGTGGIIHAYHTTGLTISNNVISGGTGVGIWVQLCTNSQVLGNTVHDLNGSGGAQGDGIFVISSNSTDNTYAHGNRIYNNTVYQVHQDAINVNGNYMSIYGNLVHDNIYSDWASVHPDGIECNGIADGFTGCVHALIYNNTVYNQGQNIYFNGNGTPAQNGDLWIFDNIVYNTATSFTGVTMASSNAGDIVLSVGTTAYLLNNTLGSGGLFDVEIGDGTGSNNPAAAFTDIHAKNNIFLTASYVAFWSYPASNIAELDYNDYFNNANMLRWGATTLNSIAAIQSNTNLEAHGSASNPLTNAFPSPTLQASSPMIGAGVNLTSLNMTQLDLDLTGTLRPRTAAWDIGAFQAGGSGSGLIPPTNMTATAH